MKTIMAAVLGSVLIALQFSSPFTSHLNGHGLPADTLKKADHEWVKSRYLAIGNVCAWPNLSVLNDGTIIATIFNKPSHGLVEGDAECWASTDGITWKKQGSPAIHDRKNSNRTNLAAGIARNGSLVVLAGGWLLEHSGPPDPDGRSVQRPWICRSEDGGKTWSIDKKSFPGAEPGRTHFLPFGDIVQGSDGSLHATGYSLTRDRTHDKVVTFRSKDDGQTWEVYSVISDKHNEAALLHIGNGKWITAVRGAAERVLQQFYSEDDGKTWIPGQKVTGYGQIPGHLTRLRDGRLLLSSGNRVKGRYGINVQLSEDYGVTWGEKTLLISDLTSQDSGYPSSIQLPNGDICTAYYAAGAEGHPQYHMGVLIWRLPSLSGK